MKFNIHRTLQLSLISGLLDKAKKGKAIPVIGCGGP
jgi:hypothetical protein